MISFPPGTVHRRSFTECVRVWLYFWKLESTPISTVDDATKYGGSDSQSHSYVLYLRKLENKEHVDSSSANTPHKSYTPEKNQKDSGFVAVSASKMTVVLISEY